MGIEVAHHEAAAVKEHEEGERARGARAVEAHRNLPRRAGNLPVVDMGNVGSAARSNERAVARAERGRRKGRRVARERALEEG